jgi:hypothetical protein
MKILSGVSTAGLLAMVASLSPLSAQNAPTPPPDPSACAPMNGLKFVCGVRVAEDVTAIAGTRWIIASGKLAGEGIKLVDTEAKTEQFFYTGAPAQMRPDKTLYPHCPAAPDPKTFVAHGIYLRGAQTPGRYNLYVVSHGTLESIQVFGVDARGPQPSLTWTGCVPYPTGVSKGNGVAAYSDGTIITTDEERPGTTIVQELAGEPTGDVLEWKPGSDAFHVLAGTQLAGNNGIEISPDESEFYVVAYGSRSVSVFSRKDPSKVLRSAVAPGFTPDNIRWSGDRLLAAGPTYDEPACGGTPAQARANPGRGRCNRGYVVAQLDPKAMTWSIVAYAEPNPEIGAVSAAAVVGDTLWLGANTAEGLAYRPLPSTQPPVRR